MHICITGAGIAGVTASYYLLKEGHQVTLVDSMPEPGQGASFGNGAQLSYSYVAPLADPSVWIKWPYYLFSSSSPLSLKPGIDPAQWRWLLRFLAACRADRAKRTTAALLELAFFSKQCLAQLREEQGLDFHHRTAGKLVLFADRESLQAAGEQVAFQAMYGCRQRIVGMDECLAIEPALAGAGRKWAGGVFTEDEEVGDCAKFCRGLVGLMRINPGFHYQAATRAIAPVMHSGRMTALMTESGAIQADAFVLAMGAESAAFARRAGFVLPVYPLKGYSITVSLKEDAAAAAPKVSITDLARKIVYARMENRLRVAGRVELVGMDRSIPKRAVDELASGAAQMFPQAVDLSCKAEMEPWAGFRPATPTGLPLIGPSPVKGLYLNTGHGSLGWTLACGSAALLARQIGGGKLPLNPDSFLLKA